MPARLTGVFSEGQREPKIKKNYYAVKPWPRDKKEKGHELAAVAMGEMLVGETQSAGEGEREIARAESFSAYSDIL